MGKEFFVEDELCTFCGDCINALPEFFQDSGADTAEVHSTEVSEEKMPELEKTMKECPGKAILWRK